LFSKDTARSAASSSTVESSSAVTRVTCRGSSSEIAPIYLPDGERSGTKTSSPFSQYGLGAYSSSLRTGLYLAICSHLTWTELGPKDRPAEHSSARSA